MFSVRFCVVAAFALIASVVPPTSAQSRFDVLAQAELFEVPGLRALTVRDNQLSVCYTLFVMQALPAPAPTPDPSTPPATPDEVSLASARRIRDASDRRDRQLAALKGTMSTPGQYEAERTRIEGEYERVLRTELPGSPPWANAVAGTQSGGFENPAEAVRRALIELDPAMTMKGVTTQLARLDELLRRLIEEPRVAATGPVICPTTGTARP